MQKYRERKIYLCVLLLAERERERGGSDREWEFGRLAVRREEESEGSECCCGRRYKPKVVVCSML